jgi:hypothetical protein
MTAKNFIGGVVGLALAVAACWFVYALTYNEITIGYNTGYSPTQPIPFPHNVHAGKLGMDCRYCHTTAEYSRHASVPPLNICMNCHMTVRQVNGKDSPHIAYVVDHYNNNQPIQWVKVHMLPDFVKFNHSAHLKAGKQCQECHGNVQDMAQVRQVASLSMGWCVNCHRKQENHAPTNCGTCHY